VNAVDGGWLGLGLLALLGVWLVRRLILICESANEVDWGSRWRNRLDGLNRLFCRAFHGLPRGTRPLPARGPALGQALRPAPVGAH
jgi:1-acyl-sn-glycerol-3-phosphate acyltransferase